MNKKNIILNWIVNKDVDTSNQTLNDLKRIAFNLEDKLMLEMKKEECMNYLISKVNYCLRKNDYSISKYYSKGNVVYCDFGMAHNKEIGYCHFGIILSKKNGKVFVVPMVSYQKEKKYNPKTTKVLPFLNGLKCQTILYLNDSKWINSSRIIEKKSHINVNSTLFKDIVNSVVDLIIN